MINLLIYLPKLMLRTDYVHFVTLELSRILETLKKANDPHTLHSKCKKIKSHPRALFYLSS
jgi:hypothetical protein